MKSQPRYIFEMPMQVRDYEVDSQGIVNNAVYLHYLEHTRHQFCRQAGYSFRALQQQGIDPVARHIDIYYHTPLRLADEMISCLALRREGARFIFVQDIYTAVGHRPVVKAEVEIVCLRDGRLTRGDELAEPFAEYL